MIEKIVCYDCSTENENPEDSLEINCKQCGEKLKSKDYDERLAKIIRNDPAFEKMYRNIHAVNSGGRISGGSCFIATAAMGDYDHPKVVELRSLRDHWILLKPWGQGFVNWYYKYGSKAATAIEKSKILKKLSYYLIVYPLVQLSRLLLK